MRGAVARMPPWALVALGGGAGSVARVAVVEGLTPFLAAPTATTLVNFAGSVAAGALWMRLRPTRAERSAPPTVRLSLMALLVTGFLGGFTTFSAFGAQTAMLAGTGDTRAAIVNLWISLAIAILGGMLGVALARPAANGRQ